MSFVSAVNVGFFNALKLWPETWVANTTYVLGDVVKPTTYASHSYKVTTAGTSHGTTEPTWGTTNGGTTADNTVTWTCFDPKTYNIKAPQGSTVPYITFGLLTETPIGDFADFETIENITFWVNVFSDKETLTGSMNQLSEMVDEVMDALDNITLTVTGYTSMKCLREFISSPVWDNETGIFQQNLRYRVWLDKS